jgi:N-acetylneuraminic acid mutarotase
MLAAMFVWGRVQWDAQEHSWHDVRPAAMYLLQNFQKGDQLVASDSWAFLLYLYPRGLASDANAVYGEQEAIRARLDLCEIKWFAGVNEGLRNSVLDSEVIDAAGRCGYEKVLNYPSETFHLREASPLSIFNGVVSVYRRTIDSPLPLLSWRMAAPLSMRRFDPQGVVVGDKFYLIGGLYIIQGSRYPAENSITAYDPITNLWTRVTEMPEAITHAGVAVDGIYIYMAGGLIGEHPGVTTDHVYRYDTATRQWKAMPPLPEKRAGGAAAIVNRNLHFFGGMFRDEQGVTRQDFGDHWVLNLDGEMKWARAASMPNPRNHLAGIAYDGKIYAIGGQHLFDEFNGNQNSVHRYDPSTDQWTAVAPLPFPLGHTFASTFIACNRIVSVGGVSQNWRHVDEILEYDPLADRWFQRFMGPAPRLAPAAGLVGDQLVVTGGLTTTDTNQTWAATWKCP